MPRLIVGMKSPCTEEWVEASGAATPSIAPWPNRSGRLRDFLLRRIGDEGGDGRAGAGNQRAERADQRAAQDRERRALHIGAARPHIADAELGIGGVDRHGVVDAAQELGDAEEPERQRDQLDAVVEIDDAEGEALDAGIDVGADEPEQQAEDASSRRPSSGEPLARVEPASSPSSISEQISAEPN